MGLRIALAGIGSALSLVFVALSYYLSFLTLSFTVLTSVGIMFPLSKNYYREGILSAVTVGIIGFFIANKYIIPYAAVSGLYVVLTVFLYNKKVNVILITALKIAYSCLVFWLLYKLTGLFVVNVDKIPFLIKFNSVGIYAILNLVFSLCFLAYDILLIEGYKYAKKLASRIIKK
jgi:hypothetical protein